MSFLFSKFCSFLFPKRKFRILMLGLNGVGKTSILYRIKLDEFIEVVQTIGFNLEKINYKNLCFEIWDISGHVTLWKHYYQNSDGIILVVDCNDKERLEQVKEIIGFCSSIEDLKNLPLLIFTNKQDLNIGITPQELAHILDMEKTKNRRWAIQGSSALNGIGIKEGLDWLSYILFNKI